MAWREVAPMEERVRFVLTAAHGTVGFAELCRQFGISRKTGYKWWTRYQAEGLAGMREASRRPHSSPTRLAPAVVARILRERQRHKRWGPKKLRAILATEAPCAPVPAASTIGRILQWHGLTRKTRRRRPVSQPDRGMGTPASRPNAVWAADFKGWFRTGDGQRCDPLTISDLCSRYVLACRVVPLTVQAVRPVFRAVFRRFGLPEVLRVDNGAPFGSRGACGLSRLSAWWVALGIRVEFIEPAHPEQNGGHERMHRTLKADTTRPPAATPQAQQARFDRWRREFNQERPHEALGMQRPADCYSRSPRRYTDAPAPFRYPPHYAVRRVNGSGLIKWQNRRCYLGEALTGYAVGLVELGARLYDVYFGALHLGRLEGDAPGLVAVPSTPRRRARRATPLGALLDAATNALRAQGNALA